VPVNLVKNIPNRNLPQRRGSVPAEGKVYARTAECRDHRGKIETVKEIEREREREKGGGE
jgi:hypothetical protein